MRSRRAAGVGMLWSSTAVPRCAAPGKAVPRPGSAHWRACWRHEASPPADRGVNICTVWHVCVVMSCNASSRYVFGICPRFVETFVNVVCRPPRNSNKWQRTASSVFRVVRVVSGLLMHEMSAPSPGKAFGEQRWMGRKQAAGRW